MSTLETVQEEHCPFCKIISKDNKLSKFTSYSFTPLNPLVPGHRLFVTYDHIQAGDEDYGHDLMGVFRDAIEYGAKKGVDFNILQSNGSDATQTVAHVHVHYLPREAGDNIKMPWNDQTPCTHVVSEDPRMLCQSMVDNHTVHYANRDFGQ